MRPSPCADCQVDVFEIGEYCMLQDRVWFEATPDDAEFLCIGCIEIRLLRLLTSADFNMHYQTNHKPHQSLRLKTRLTSR